MIDMARRLTRRVGPVMLDGMTDPALPAADRTTMDDARALFAKVISALQQRGFSYLRPDTLQHITDADARDPLERWVVQHQYTGGVWELHYRPDPKWNRGVQIGRTSLIKVGPPLPSVPAVLSQLFGPEMPHYMGYAVEGEARPVVKRKFPLRGVTNSLRRGSGTG